MSLRLTIALGVLCSAMAGPLARAADSAQQLYREALAKEQALRAEADPPPSDWRAAIRAYEAIVRRYPTSGYSDNALWQAAGLARDLFAQTGDVREKDRAARLLRALVSEYPSSKLVPASVVDITSLAGAGLGAGSPPPPPAATASPPPASRPIPGPSTFPPDAGRTLSGPPGSPLQTGRVLVRAINRIVLPEVVRIVVELDAEVSFHHERIENPTRVFVDLQGTQVTPALRDAVLTYGDDIVRQVRIGRHPANTTRIVLDVTNLARYSFFTLYQPFRLVIDCERAPVGAGVLSPSMHAASATGVLSSRPLGTTWISSMPVLSASAIAATRDDEPSRRIDATGVSAAALPAPLPPSANGRGGFSIARQLGLGASRIVIDPGHGGHDPGALKERASEADLVLDIALRLEQLLLKQPGFEVVLTRRTDSYVALEERTAIANREGADLFLSIHANASGNANTRGVETYFLNFAPTADAAAVAARENATSERTMSSLPDLVKAITLSNKREESRDFAVSVQRALFQRLPKAGMRNLGVRQAPFVVLIGAEMPSILTEVAFLTNRQDQQLLKNSAYRQLIAEALLSGILRYHQTLKSSNGRLAQQ